MNTHKIRTLLLLFGLAFGVQRQAHGSEQPAYPSIELQILSSLIGYVEPCGCTIDVMLGGLDRLTGLMKASRPKGTKIVRFATGPTYFEPNAPPHRRVQDELKASLILRSFKEAGLEYQVVTDAAKTANATTSRTSIGPKTIHKPTLIDESGIKIAVIPVIGPSALQQLRKSAPPIVSQANLVLLFSDTSRRELRRFMRDVPWVDIAILANHAREMKVLEPVGEGYILEAGDRGRHLARLKIESPLRGRPLMYEKPEVHLPKNDLFSAPVSAQHDRKSRQGNARLFFDLVPLDENVPRDPIMTAALLRYNQELKRIYRQSPQEDAPLEAPDAQFAGLSSCGDCHPEALKFWRSTKHARAWQTLEEKDKTFDQECVGCHVTGWQETGGSRMGLTKGLENIQCEACHRGGKAHAESGGDPTLLRSHFNEKSCETCHNQHHSPRFSYPVYKRKILGIGHGVAPTDSR